MTGIFPPRGGDGYRAPPGKISIQEASLFSLRFQKKEKILSPLSCPGGQQEKKWSSFVYGVHDFCRKGGISSKKRYMKEISIYIPK